MWCSAKTGSQFRRVSRDGTIFEAELPVRSDVVEDPPSAGAGRDGTRLMTAGEGNPALP
jgi:hypothetical protein